MKQASLIIWVTQLGLSVAVPPVVAIWAAVWLRDSRGWGNWVVWVGIALGILCAVDGLRVSLKALERLSASRKDRQDPGVSFNDHQ